MKFKRQPLVIEATQWFKNGDHPNDGYECEGTVVRYFRRQYRRPDISDESACRHCGVTMHVHGWIDTKEGGHIVCPGDWIITGVWGERYPCKPNIFEISYAPIE